MFKTEFIASVNKDLKAKGLSKDLKESSAIVNTILDHLTSLLSEGRTVQFENLGTFKSSLENKLDVFSKDEKPKMISRFIIRFNCSQTLKKRINANYKKTEKTS